MYNNYNNSDNQKEKDIVNWINGSEISSRSSEKKNYFCKECELSRIHENNYHENVADFFKDNCNLLNSLNIELRKELSFLNSELSKTKFQYESRISHLNSELSISKNSLSVLKNVYDEFYQEYVKSKKREQQLVDYIEGIDLKTRRENLNSNFCNEYSQSTLVERSNY